MIVCINPVREVEFVLSRVAHGLGIAGELLNFVGGAFLAYDVLLRPQERIEGKQLSDMSDFAKKFGLETLEYKGFALSSSNFQQDVLDQRVTRLGWVGVIFLLGGFLLLAIYHYLEM